jgi:ABC-type multidrug transport system fused ATPase/permease subunit
MRDLRIILEVLISGFLFFVYVMVMFQIVIDLFRDRDLGGGAKALWMIALLLFPFIAALLYIVTRGRGMAERSQTARARGLSHLREYMSSASVDEISRAKTLLDQGVIDNEEFAVLKRRALAHA